jgi:NADH-quinone oxidoreductase subunit N
MLAGVVVASSIGLKSVVFYLLVYLLMNVAAFAVVIARERETGLGDDIESVTGIGASRPTLAWPLTIAMIALAGLPGTAGFFGKFFLIEATVEGGFTWLGVVIVVGSMVSLAYYLRVVAAVWMRPAPEPKRVRARVAPVMAGGSPEADAGLSRRLGPTIEAEAIAVVTAAAVIGFGILPSPLLDLASNAARAVFG